MTTITKSTIEAVSTASHRFKIGDIVTYYRYFYDDEQGKNVSERYTATIIGLTHGSSLAVTGIGLYRDTDLLIESLCPATYQVLVTHIEGLFGYECSLPEGKLMTDCIQEIEISG